MAECVCEGCECSMFFSLHTLYQDLSDAEGCMAWREHMHRAAAPYLAALPVTGLKPRH